MSTLTLLQYPTRKAISEYFEACKLPEARRQKKRADEDSLHLLHENLVVFIYALFKKHYRILNQHFIDCSCSEWYLPLGKYFTTERSFMNIAIWVKCPLFSLINPLLDQFTSSFLNLLPKLLTVLNKM